MDTLSKSKTNESRYFEGCGFQGPIRCIFLCEFHPIAGPKITCQVPDDYITKEIFDAVSVYIIPKPQLQRSILTVNVLGHKITGFPVKIDNTKYARNAYYFNLCFVCDAWARTVQYEPLVKKLSEYLIMMEAEEGFLSNDDPEGDRSTLPEIFSKILKDLNTSGICTITEKTTKMHLKVVNATAADPPPVYDHQVPIFVVNKQLFKDQWDLTTQQVLPYINGFNHISKIALEADVENNLVKACIQNLVYYGVVKLIPIFQYNNVYTPTPGLKNLITNKQTQEKCIDYVCKEGCSSPQLHDILELYCSMTPGTTLHNLCVRHNPHSLKIDESKLIQFGLINKFIRRIHKYPVYIESSTHNMPQSSLYKYFNGVLSYDEICCTTGMSTQSLDEEIETDPDVIVIWK